MEPILRATAQVDSVLSADGWRPARRCDDAGRVIFRQAGSLSPCYPTFLESITTGSTEGLRLRLGFGRSCFAE